MSEQKDTTLQRIVRMLRFTTIITLPLGLIFSFHYAFTVENQRYWNGRQYWSSATIAPTIGIITLLVSFVFALVELGYIQRFFRWLCGREYEYRIVLPQDKDQGKKDKREITRLLVVLTTDISLLIGSWIVGGVTLGDICGMYSDVIVVYAFLPYGIAGTAHGLLVFLDIYSLLLLREKKKKTLTCPRCRLPIVGNPMSGSVEESPKMSSAQPQREQDTEVIPQEDAGVLV